MLKIDKKYYYTCKRDIVHNYIGSKSDFEELGLVLRGIMALSSLGVTETLCRSKYWQCSKCRDIRED